MGKGYKQLSVEKRENEKQDLQPLLQALIRKLLTKLYAELIERVHTPDDALNKDLVFIKGQQRTQTIRIQTI